MERRTNLLLGTLLAAGVVAAVWLVWFRPRGYAASDLQGGFMALDKTTVQYLSRSDGLFSSSGPTCSPTGTQALIPRLLNEWPYRVAQHGEGRRWTDRAIEGRDDGWKGLDSNRER
jgi:hypothetical protein